MKKLFILFISSLVILSACSKKVDEIEQVENEINQTEQTNSSQIIGDNNSTEDDVEDNQSETNQESIDEVATNNDPSSNILNNPSSTLNTDFNNKEFGKNIDWFMQSSNGKVKWITYLESHFLLQFNAWKNEGVDISYIKASKQGGFIPAYAEPVHLDLSNAQWSKLVENKNNVQNDYLIFTEDDYYYILAVGDNKPLEGAPNTYIKESESEWLYAGINLKDIYNNFTWVDYYEDGIGYPTDWVRQDNVKDNYNKKFLTDVDNIFYDYFRLAEQIEIDDELTVRVTSVNEFKNINYKDKTIYTMKDLKDRNDRILTTYNAIGSSGEIINFIKPDLATPEPCTEGGRGSN